MSQLTADEATVLAAVDDVWTIARLSDLVGVPTVTGSPAESEGQHLLAGWLRELDLDVDLWPIDLPSLAADPDFPGTEAPRSEAWGLVATLGGTAPASAGSTPALALCGHLDVVPPGDRRLWSQDPFSPTVRGGALVGRGACDMKGGLVAALAAVHAVARSGVRLRHGLALHSVVGEEDGGLGAFATLRRGHRAAACVIPEPTDGALCTANAGALSFRLTIEGRAAHGAVRNLGVSAIEKFEPIHRALLALEATRNADPDPRFGHLPLPYALSIGTVRAGDWGSTVPDTLVAEGRYGVQVGEPVPVARAAFEAAVADAAAADPWLADHPVQVGWTGGQFASGAVPPGAALPGQLQAAVTALTGGPVPERAAPYGSDLRLYTAAGIPTVHYGPGRARFAHAPDEQIDLAEVLAAARVLALLAVRLCGAP